MMAFRTRQLVRRLALRIHEPHGRYVKLIRLSFCSASVTSLSEVAVPEHLDRWQPLTTLSLTHGQTTAEVELPVPAVIGCLLIEYDEFYPQAQAGASSSSAGQPAGRGAGMGGLHCPQCGRQVVDPHGFCRHCGEVAFQCRLCRHINYERFDAFLCVECGYCAYGTFTYRCWAQPTPSSSRVTTQAQADELARMYLTSMTQLQEEQGRLNAMVPEVRRILREAERAGPAAKEACVGGSDVWGCLVEAAAAATDSVEACLSASLRSALSGRVVPSRKAGAGVLAPPIKAARFVLVADGLRDPDTESRDEDEDDEEEPSPSFTGAEAEDSRASTSSAVRAAEAAAQASASASPGPPPPVAQVQATLFDSGLGFGSARLLESVSGAREEGRAVRAEALEVSGGVSAVVSSRSQGVGTRQPSASSTSSSPLLAGSGVPASALSRPTAPLRTLTSLRSTSGTGADGSPMKRPFWTTNTSSAPKEPVKRVQEYFNRSCKAVVDKMANHARDLLVSSEDLLAFRKGTPGALEGLEGEGVGADCSVAPTTCYGCGCRLSALMLRVLLSLVRRRSGVDTLLESRWLEELVARAARVGQPVISALARKLVKEICVADGSLEAVRRVRGVVAEGLLEMGGVGGARAASYQALLDTMADLCSLDVRDLERRMPSWGAHLRLPLEVLRRAAAARDEGRELAAELVLPCLQVLTAVCSGNYPEPLMLHCGSSQGHALVKALAREVLEEALAPAALREVSQAQADSAWVRVEQERGLAQVRRVADKWSARARGKGLGDAKASRLEDGVETSWLLRLLLSEQSMEVRKHAACLVLTALRALFGDDGAMTDDDDEDDDEAEDEEEHGHDMEEEEEEETKEDVVVVEAATPLLPSPSPGRMRRAAREAARLAALEGLLKSRMVDALMGAVGRLLCGGGHDKVQGERSLQLFATLRHLASAPDMTAFLVLRGALPFLCRAISEEVASLRRLEQRVLLGLGRPETRALGVTLLQLVEMLNLVVGHPHVRVRVARQPRLVADVLRVYLEVKLSLVLKSSAMEASASTLEDLAACAVLSEGGGADEEAVARAYLLACVEVLREKAVPAPQRPGLPEPERRTRATATYLLLKNLQSTLCPPRKRARFRIHLRRAPSQEEFFRGSIAKNPIWVEDLLGLHAGGQHDEREPTVRDLRALVARELNIADAVELLELLATGRILSLDLPLRVVFQGLWRPYVVERHPDDYSLDLQPELCPPLIVTYRLAGVDGEATEEVVETLGDEEHDVSAEARREVRTARLVGALGEGACLPLLLQLAHPPHAPEGGAQAWETATLAAALLRQCAKGQANRMRLLQLNGPGILLTSLLTALRLTSCGEAGLSSLTERLLQVIEELGGGGENLTSTGLSAAAAGELPGVGVGVGMEQGSDGSDQVEALLDALADGALVEVVGQNAALTRAVGRLLPFLTYGRQASCRTLADRIRAEVDWGALGAAEGEQGGGGADRLRVTVMLESLVALDKDASAVGRVLRDRLLDNGFTAAVVAAIRAGLPEVRSAKELVRRSSRDKEGWEAEWRAAVEAPARLQALRVLTGLARGHAGTQALLVAEGLLASLHAMEEMTSSGQAGALAEALLEGMCEQDAPPCCPEAAAAVAALRKETREQKRAMAQQNRQRALMSIGFMGNMRDRSVSMEVDASTSTSTSTARPGDAAASPPQAQEQQPQTAPSPRTSAAAAAALSMGAMLMGGGDGAAKPKWMEEMDALEEEEGLRCMVCQEGYSFKPKEVLGVYVHSKTLALPAAEVARLQGSGLLGGGRDAGSSAAATSSNVDMTGGLCEEIEAMESMLGRSVARAVAGGAGATSRVVSTVTAFNLIHFSCHAEAARADRALKQPKSEWDGAALRNSRVACNGMLPLRGPASTAEAYRLAVEKYFASRVVGGGGGGGGGAAAGQLSRFVLVTHDVRLLLLRIAFKESLRDDSGGGSLARCVHLDNTITSIRPPLFLIYSVTCCTMLIQRTDV
jgi:hypothetical protein